MNTNNSNPHIYSNLDLRKLLIPIIIEQLLSSLMGTVDTMMVSNVGSAAISAVSLVDSINILVIQALSALSAGGAILCSQYLGSKTMMAPTNPPVRFFLSCVFIRCTFNVLPYFQISSAQIYFWCGGC